MKLRLLYEATSTAQGFIEGLIDSYKMGSGEVEPAAKWGYSDKAISFNIDIDKALFDYINKNWKDIGLLKNNFSYGGYKFIDVVSRKYTSVSDDWGSFRFVFEPTADSTGEKPQERHLANNRYKVIESNSPTPGIVAPDINSNKIEMLSYKKFQLIDTSDEFPVDLFEFLDTHNQSKGRRIVGWIGGKLYKIPTGSGFFISEIQSDIKTKSAKLRGTKYNDLRSKVENRYKYWYKVLENEILNHDAVFVIDKESVGKYWAINPSGSAFKPYDYFARNKKTTIELPGTYDRMSWHQIK